MKTTWIQSRQGAYPVHVGAHLLATIGDVLEERGITTQSNIAVITDSHVAQAGHAETVRKACVARGFSTCVLVIPPGDASKTLQTVEDMYNQLLDAGIRRNGVVIAVGGGVVGDLAGFVAATYQRGIHFIQAPTTLLAHDSSIGGKVGVNLARGKNLVGAFYPPLAVVYDVATFNTLPTREWVNGMAEVIKESLIGDENLFCKLEAHPLPSCPHLDVATDITARAMQVKVNIVEEDEREGGRRMALNLGHSVGHAVEQLSNYSIGHGEAVAIGIAVESNIAVARSLLTETDRMRILRILANHGLPIVPPDYSFEAVAGCISVDKKNIGSMWTFAIPSGIGAVTVVADITQQEVETAWQRALFGGMLSS